MKLRSSEEGEINPLIMCAEHTFAPHKSYSQWKDCICMSCVCVCVSEGEDDSVMDELMVEWFNLIRNKQLAMRRESELVYMWVHTHTSTHTQKKGMPLFTNKGNRLVGRRLTVWVPSILLHSKEQGSPLPTDSTDPTEVWSTSLFETKHAALVVFNERNILVVRHDDNYIWPLLGRHRTALITIIHKSAQELMETKM